MDIINDIDQFEAYTYIDVVDDQRDMETKWYDCLRTEPENRDRCNICLYQKSDEDNEDMISCEMCMVAVHLS